MVESLKHPCNKTKDTLFPCGTCSAAVIVLNRLYHALTPYQLSRALDRMFHVMQVPSSAQGLRRGTVFPSDTSPADSESVSLSPNVSEH